MNILTISFLLAISCLLIVAFWWLPIFLPFASNLFIGLVAMLGFFFTFNLVTMMIRVG